MWYPDFLEADEIEYTPMISSTDGTEYGETIVVKVKMELRLDRSYNSKGQLIESKGQFYKKCGSVDFATEGKVLYKGKEYFIDGVNTYSVKGKDVYQKVLLV